MRVVIQVVSPERAFAHELPEGVDVLVGRGTAAGVRLADSSVAARHLVLRARGGAVEVEDLSGGRTRLNDVQLSRTAIARPGDQLALGDTVLIFLGRRDRPALRPRIAAREELEARIDEELAAGRRVGLVLVTFAGSGDVRRPLVESVGGLWAELGEHGLELLVPGVDEAGFSAVRDRVTGVLGAAGARFRVGYALSPGDAFDADGLYERALSRLTGAAPDEPLFADEAMLHLLAAIERVAKAGANVALVGPAGAGKETLARLLQGRLGGGPVVVVRNEAQLDEALSSSGALIVKRVERWSEASRSRLSSAGRRLWLTSAADIGGLVPHVVQIPALADRPDDLSTLAEHFLSRARKLHQRARVALSAEARTALESHLWPGNVRELKNAMELAVICAEGDEVRLDHLPSPVRRGRERPKVTDLRGALKETEKAALLEVLATTRWNVTEAAKRLGLPRRTVVYRMARLGLKRPRRVDSG